VFTAITSFIITSCDNYMERSRQMFA